MEDVKIIKAIGEGSFGTVYLAEYHNFPVACKLIKTGINEDNISKVLEELRVMRRLKHPNVVMLMGACFSSDQNLMIITELAGRGDMKTVLKEVNSFSLQWDLAHGAVKGLNWLQSYNIIHRDLKLDNLLVTEDWTVKLTDFGLSIELGEGQSYGNWGGNVKYAAPELLSVRYPHLVSPPLPTIPGEKKEYPYSEKTDIYSFGLIWWQIMTKRDPFLPRPKEYKGGKEPLARYILSNPRPLPMIPPTWPHSLAKIFTRCWALDPAHRPTFSEILDHWSDLTIDLLCCDPLGKKIGYTMLERFGKKTKFPTFRSLFIEECMTKPKLPLQDRILLENLLRESSFNDTVTFDRFCYVVGWFGPMEPGCSAFFSRIKDLLNQKNFRGYLSELRVKEDLADLNTTSKRKRNYIIRYSLEAMGEFILSFTDKERKEGDNSGKEKERDNEWKGERTKEKEGDTLKIEHWKVRNQDGMLVMNGSSYRSWKDLLQDIGFVE
eukprot:TRINITY_DN5156_c0_g1_i3.p1 TRINITY_DN5156_c0_g1~~TRINITY_DN5156_c0_g1_i3.p1  ORF type:complete len:492 (-),score=68.33 TRINITY_DN5156_c0_g1_i3:24-1499(-)